MIFIISLFLFIKNIYAFNCNVSQIHIAQGLNSHSMTISWITESNCFSHVVYGLNSKNLDTRVHGSSSNYDFIYKKDNVSKYYQSGYIHHVLLTNLKPVTKYYYQCGDLILNIASEIISFTTLPKPGDSINRLTFGVLGDIGQTVHSQSTIKHLMNEKIISMILHAGDLSYADCDQILWDSYGLMIEPLASNIPWMVCPGNHEIEFNGSDYMNLYTAFEKRYRMPYFKQAEFGNIIIKSDINPNTGLPYCTPSIFQSEYNFGNSFYSFESGLAHIIFLNPYTNSSPTSLQYNWLQNDLILVNRNITPWIIVVMHCPWYSSNKNHYSDTQTVYMKESMEALFYNFNVNIVFNGHVHDYERTYPVYNNKVNNFGPTYITIGNAGNLEGLDNKYYDKPNWSAFRNGTEYGYGKFTIINKNTAYWEWFINNGKQMFPRDEVLLCNSVFGSAKCH